MIAWSVIAGKLGRVSIHNNMAAVSSVFDSLQEVLRNIGAFQLSNTSRYVAGSSKKGFGSLGRHFFLAEHKKSALIVYFFSRIMCTLVCHTGLMTITSARNAHAHSDVPIVPLFTN